MKRIKNVSKVVEETLYAEPSTRNSDTLLFYKVCLKANPTIRGLAFSTVLLNANDLGIPNYETVRRTRQKLQETYPELRATKEVTEGRYEAFKEVLDYVSK